MDNPFELPPDEFSCCPVDLEHMDGCFRQGIKITWKSYSWTESPSNMGGYEESPVAIVPAQFDVLGSIKQCSELVPLVWLRKCDEAAMEGCVFSKLLSWIGA